MFGLFSKNRSRRAVQDWELVLMYKTIEKLPSEFESLRNQIEAEIFDLAFIGYNKYDPDYVGLSSPWSVREFEHKYDRDYEITNIKVADINGENVFKYTIFVSEGIIMGYSIMGLKNSVIDVLSADVSRYVRRFDRDGDNDYQVLKKILSKEEIVLVNPNDVYEISLKNRVFYHIRDLDDGDFIGIEDNGQVCKITHDPFEITSLQHSLAEVLTQNIN